MIKLYYYLLEASGEYPFNFITTYSKPESKREYPIKYLFSEYKDDNKELVDILAFIDEVGKKSELLKKFIQTGEFFHPIGLTGKETNVFLQEIEIYEKMGIACRLPKWNEKEKKVKVNPGIKEKRETSMGVLNFNVTTSIDGTDITVEELRKIAEQLEPLALIKNKWVKVDKNQIRKTVEVIDKLEKMASGEDITEIMEAKKEIEEVAKENDIEITFTNAQWLEILTAKIKNPVRIPEITLDNLRAELRVYQVEGVKWLNYMHTMGLGACLCDDMGLGKTLQVISFLNHLGNSKKEKSLVVVPVSLLKNWQNEITKFAPNLKYYVIHTSENAKLNPKSIKGFDNYDIFITTYSYFYKQEWMFNMEWDNIILDEAQAIKNPDTQQTLNVKRLNGKFKVAMTGTPFENNIIDMWSIFDFLNPGLLGTQDEFRNFCRRNKQKYVQIRKITEFFILRRMKTDKSIIADLPEKIEQNVMVDMSVKQIALYTNLIDRIKSADIKNVLPFLVKFKSICNHPSQYLGQEDFSMEDSGKFIELKKICEEIKERNEKVIIFTQFKEIIEPLYDFVSSIFETDGLYLHGSVPANKRGKIVEQFQNEDYPFIICSIKACGVGLTLTAANNVVHYDRWWNPAIESQATDRAYRIGQTKDVNVYKFVTKGTMEEGINALLEEKIEIFKTVVPEKQDKWLSDCINSEMIRTFKLAK